MLEHHSNQNQQGIGTVRQMKKTVWIIQSLSTLLYYFLGGVLIGIALIPSLGVLYLFWSHTNQWIPIWRVVFFSILCGFGWFVFGFALLIAIVVLNRIFPVRQPEGTWPLSSGLLRWTYHNSCVAMANYIFLKFLFLSPYAIWFFRGMGAKMGKRIQLNSGQLTDVYLIEIGDDCVVGSEARIICHQMSRGRLTLKRVKIGNRVMIGIMSVICPGVEIGDDATVMPNSFVLKNTKIPPGTVWGGVPAIQITRRPGKGERKEIGIH